MVKVFFKSKICKFSKLLLFVFLLISLYVVFNFFDFSSFAVYAQEVSKAGQQSTDNNTLKDLVKFLNELLKFLSWFWIIPAIVAGKLMTNGWVYGSNIGLDTYLWQMWRIMLNFANLFLAFLFLGLIIRSFIKGNGMDIIKQKIPRLIVALVLVNFSWFFIGALVDISNVLVATVGSIPSSLDFVKNELGNTITIPEKVTIDFTKSYGELISEIKNISTNSNTQTTIKLEDILPKYDSVSGPLIFFGASVLNLFSVSDINNNEVTWVTFFQSNFLKLVLVIMFIIPLIVLAIVNFVRVLWIWIFIVFSPFIIIEAVFGGLISNKIEYFKKLSIGNLIGLIFMPVAVVATLTMGLIFVATLKNLLESGTNQSNDFVKTFSCSTNSSKSKDNKYVCINTNAGQIYLSKSSIFEDAGKLATGAIGKIILFLFVIFFLWSLLPIGFRMAELTSNISTGVFNFVENMAKVTPILPGGTSIAVLEKVFSKRMIGTEVFDKIQAKQSERITDFVNKLTGVYSKKLTPVEVNELKQALREGTGIGKLKNFAKVLKEIATNKEVGWSLQADPELKEVVREFLLDLPKSSGGDLVIKKTGLSVLYDKKGNLKPGWDKSPELGRLLEAIVEGKLDNVESISNIEEALKGVIGAPANTLNLGRK